MDKYKQKVQTNNAIVYAKDINRLIRRFLQELSENPNIKEHDKKEIKRQLLES